MIMAKSPHQKHSKSRDKSLTIDLEAVDQEATTTDGPPDAEPVGFADDAGTMAAAPVKGEPEFVEQEAAAPADLPADEPRPVKPAPVAAAAGKSSSGAITGGIVGAVLALLGAGGLQWAGLLPSATTPETVEAAPDPRIETMAQRLASLETTVASAGTAEPAPVDTAALEALGARIETAETRIATLEQRTSELASAATAPEPTQAPAADTVSPAPQGVASADLDAVKGDIDSLKSEVSRIDTAVAEVAAGVETATEAATAATGRLDAVDATLASLGAQVTEKSAQPSVATAIAAAALKSAIDRGGPFMNELETFATVSDQTDAIAKLRDMAGTGVPTTAQLTAGFGDVANAMLDAVKQVPPDAGLMDRLMSSAQGLIKTRKVGEVEGDDAEAIIARMESRVITGNLEAALEQYDALPDAAKAAGAAYADQLRARIEANTLVRETLDAALAAARG
jgi:hypothetical protein